MRAKEGRRGTRRGLLRCLSRRLRGGAGGLVCHSLFLRFDFGFGFGIVGIGIWRGRRGCNLVLELYCVVGL